MTPSRDQLKTALLVIAFVGMLIVIRDLRVQVQDASKDTRCILNELSDHRHANKAADVVQIEQMGGDASNLPTPPTLPDTPEWDKACDHILGETHHQPD